MEKDMKLLAKYMQRLAKKYPGTYITTSNIGKDTTVTYREIGMEKDTYKDVSIWGDES